MPFGVRTRRRAENERLQIDFGFGSVTRRLSDGSDGRRFDDRRLGLVGDQVAQERNETEGSET
jgi:hypothetical protein